MAVLEGDAKLKAALDALARRLRVTEPLAVRVGFFEDAKYDDGTPVATVAAINNFGAPGRGIPPRPFFSNMVAAKSPIWGDVLASIMRENDNDARKSLNNMGEFIANQLRRSIVETREPANSPVTNLLKDRFPTRDGMTFEDVLQAFRDVATGNGDAPTGKPLVWSGKMLESVASEVI